MSCLRGILPPDDEYYVNSILMIRLFRHYIPGRAMLLLLVEAFIFYGAVHFALLVRFLDTGLAIHAGQDVSGRALVFSGIMVASMLVGGLYDYWELEGGSRGVLLRLGTAFAIGFLGTVLAFYLFPSTFLGRGVYLIAYFSSLVVIAAMRLAVLKWARWEGLKRRVLILGTGHLASRINDLDQNGTISDRLSIFGYYPCGGGMVVNKYVDKGKLLSPEDPLVDLVKRHQIQEIVVAIRDRRSGFPLNELLECRMQGVRVTESSTFFERELGQLPLDALNASWMIFSDGFQTGTSRDFNKRIFDLVASGLLLACTLPVMLVAGLLIYMESGAPLIYRQERVGLNGKVYTIYKFRSMRVDAEQGGVPQWAQQNDSRITRVGQVLRKLRIDELPQIFNVFKGDMSFIGPRPERPFFVEQLTAKLPYYQHRHSVKPGISGWAQVRYAYGASMDDSMEKLQYDLYYVKNHSMFLDFLIMLQTVQVVLWGKGAR